MEIQETRQGAVTVLKPVGPLVGNDAEQFLREVSEAVTRNLGRLVVDASAVQYTDSRGLEVLAELAQELEQSGQAMRLCATGETLREVLELTGLNDLFEHYADVTTAVRSFL